MRLDGILMNFNYADVSRLPSYLSHVRAKKELFTCGEASRSMDDIWLLSSFRKICPIQPFRVQRGTGTWVIEATEFKFEVRSDLRSY